MSYLSLVLLCGIKFPTNLKEQLASTHSNIISKELFERNWKVMFLRNILLTIIIIIIIPLRLFIVDINYYSPFLLPLFTISIIIIVISHVVLDTLSFEPVLMNFLLPFLFLSFFLKGSWFYRWSSSSVWWSTCKNTFVSDGDLQMVTYKFDMDTLRTDSGSNFLYSFKFLTSWSIKFYSLLWLFQNAILHKMLNLGFW